MATLSAVAITSLIPVGCVQENKISGSSNTIIVFIIFYVNIKKSLKIRVTFTIKNGVIIIKQQFPLRTYFLAEKNTSKAPVVNWKI